MDATTASGRRKRLIVLGVTTVLLCVCAFGISHFAAHPFGGMGAEHLNADLQAGLPTGSTMDEGRAWFARHGIEPEERTRPDYDSPEWEAGLDAKLYTLYARIPSNSLFETADIVVCLEYGSARRLDTATVGRYVNSQ